MEVPQFLCLTSKLKGCNTHKIIPVNSFFICKEFSLKKLTLKQNYPRAERSSGWSDVHGLGESSGAESSWVVLVLVLLQIKLVLCTDTCPYAFLV